MKKFLNFEEYNTILLAINTSTDYVVYGKDKKKELLELNKNLMQAI